MRSIRGGGAPRQVYGQASPGRRRNDGRWQLRLAGLTRDFRMPVHSARLVTTVQEASPSSAGPGLEQLARLLENVLQDCRASIGALYLLPPGGKALELAMLSGGPRKMAAPWARIALDDPMPLADAVRQRGLVWVGSQEEMARRYPRLGFVLPYDFMLAAVPFTHGDTVWGGLVLLWPVWHPPALSSRERDTIDDFCRHAGLLLQRAADEGQPLLAEPTPRTLAPLRHTTPEHADALAAHQFTERLLWAAAHWTSMVG